MNGANTNSENQTGYFIDTNLCFNFANNNANNLNINGANSNGNSDTGVNLSNNITISSHSAPATSISFSNELYHSHYHNPPLDYVQCVSSSGDASIASSESSATKLSFISSGQEQSLSAILISSQGQNNNNCFNNYQVHSNNPSFDELEENNNNSNEYENKDSVITKRGRGRGRGNGISHRKRHSNVSPNSCNGTNDSGNLSTSSNQSKSKHGKALARHPFIPSYMDPKSGPHLCVVCQHNASGFHYRVMACEGCKGFFRRTVQNNLRYTCKFNNSCEILPHNRAQCQECRWNKCLKVGMAKDLVLSEEARRAKKELIAANRAKRQASVKQQNNNNSNNNVDNNNIECQSKENESLLTSINDSDNNYQNLVIADRGKIKLLSEEDEYLIDQIVKAFDETNIELKDSNGSNGYDALLKTNSTDYHNIQQCVIEFHITSLIVKCDIVDKESIEICKAKYPTYFNVLHTMVESVLQKIVLFGCLMPRFCELTVHDRIILLQHAVFDLICLRHVMCYDYMNQLLKLTNHNALSSAIFITQADAKSIKILEPVFSFCRRVAPLEMDSTEVSLMAALALITSDRLGLQEPSKVDMIQDNLLTLMDGYLRDNNRNNPPSHRQSELYATVLPELRTATNWHHQLVQNNLSQLLLTNNPDEKLAHQQQQALLAVYQYQPRPHIPPPPLPPQPPQTHSSSSPTSLLVTNTHPYPQSTSSYQPQLHTPHHLYPMPNAASSVILGAPHTQLVTQSQPLQPHHQYNILYHPHSHPQSQQHHLMHNIYDTFLHNQHTSSTPVIINKDVNDGVADNGNGRRRILPTPHIISTTSANSPTISNMDDNFVSTVSTTTATNTLSNTNNNNDDNSNNDNAHVNDTVYDITDDFMI